MRRITKKLLKCLFGLIFIGLYCEYFIYYVVVAQCYWPAIESNAENSEILKAFILADTHLLGPYRGHWFDKLRREWQMHQAFQAIINVHNPDVVFILGDLFDEGEWTDEKQFEDYVVRFYNLFAVPNDTKMYVAVGNHDVGFHNRIRRGSLQRFVKLLKSPSVQHIYLKGSHFVLLNSMAMQGDSCRLCTGARNSIEKISGQLKCAREPGGALCKDVDRNFTYSQPILMQHFPLYRLSDAECTEPDAPPLPERNKLFRIKIDALSKEATEYLAEKIQPRVAFGGHTHHGCLQEHSYNSIKFEEHSVPSFSWRNRPDPKYMLVTIAPDSYAENKCGLPKETTIIMTGAIMTLLLIIYMFKERRIGRGIF
ncbi:metallophosphoesterase 1 homolog [Epargyreus clarus]|uniref:metallophosphoesterase 1 homolog n=1 Tax=Epargyreus clarus TaxID=520877 RepID=UPI003C2B67B7